MAVSVLGHARRSVTASAVVMRGRDGAARKAQKTRIERLSFLLAHGFEPNYRLQVGGRGRVIEREREMAETEASFAAYMTDRAERVGRDIQGSFDRLRLLDAQEDEKALPMLKLSPGGFAGAASVCAVFRVIRVVASEPHVDPSRSSRGRDTRKRPRLSVFCMLGLYRERSSADGEILSELLNSYVRLHQST